MLTKAYKLIAGFDHWSHFTGYIFCKYVAS